MTWYAEILPGLFLMLAVSLAWAGAAVIQWWRRRRELRRWPLPFDERMRP